MAFTCTPVPAASSAADFVSPLAAYIGTDELRFCTFFADFADQLLAFIVMPTGNNNLCAFVGKREGRCPPDACQCSCNQNNLGVHLLFSV